MGFKGQYYAKSTQILKVAKFYVVSFACGYLDAATLNFSWASSNEVEKKQFGSAHEVAEK